MGSGLQDLRKITTFCRKNGILRYRNEHFEIQLSRQSLKLPKPRGKEEVSLGAMPPGMSDQDLLFYSSTPAGING